MHIKLQLRSVFLSTFFFFIVIVVTLFLQVSSVCIHTSAIASAVCMDLAAHLTDSLPGTGGSHPATIAPIQGS